MSPQIIVSAHAPVEITKPHKVGSRYAVLEAGLCSGVLNGIKAQMIQTKTAIRGIEMSLNIFCEWFYASKHVRNKRRKARRHEKYI